MNVCEVLIFSFFLFSLSFLGVSGDESVEKPNVVFILIDDLGFNDVSYHGSIETKTPNIDSLARSGTVLTRHYTQPVCTPSRGALLTSKYAIHLGLQDGCPAIGCPCGLPLSEILMSQYFQQLGYETNAIGKWNLGFYKQEYLPTNRGFETFLGIYYSSLDYYAHTIKHGDYFGLDLHSDTGNSSQPLWDLFGEYTTDLFTAHAKRLIVNRNKTKPFFLYFAHEGVHTPIMGKDSLLTRFKDVYAPDRANYLTQVAAVDDSVGEVVKILENEGILENTLLVVASDNGGPVSTGSAQSNYPLRSGKTYNFEGGVRTPAFIIGPGVAKHRHYNNLFHLVDWLPTLLDAIGENATDLPADLDGVSHWLNLEESSENYPSPREELLVNINTENGESAIIYGDYKLHYVTNGLHGDLDKWYNYTGPLNDTDTIRVYEKDGWKLPVVNCTMPSSYTECDFLDEKEGLCLFNIKDDPCEYNNIAAEEPEMVDFLMGRLQFYNESVVPTIVEPSDSDCNPALRGNVWGPWRS